MKGAWQHVSVAECSGTLFICSIVVSVELNTLQGHRLTKRECQQRRVVSLFLESGASVILPFPWGAAKKHLWYAPGNKCSCAADVLLLCYNSDFPLEHPGSVVFTSWLIRGAGREHRLLHFKGRATRSEHCNQAVTLHSEIFGDKWWKCLGSRTVWSEIS